MPDMPDDDKAAYLQKLKDLMGKASQTVVGEGEEKPAPLEGYGAMKAGLPADPGAAAGVTPTGSPIDVLAGGVGSKLGGAIARDSSGILGNEIGSIGSDINAPNLPKFVPMPAGSGGATERFLNILKQQNPERAEEFAAMSTQQAPKAMMDYAQGQLEQAAKQGTSSPYANLVPFLQQKMNALRKMR